MDVSWHPFDNFFCLTCFSVRADVIFNTKKHILLLKLGYVLLSHHAILRESANKNLLHSLDRILQKTAGAPCLSDFLVDI